MSTIRSVNPANGKVLATFEEDTDQIVDRKLATAAVAVSQLAAAGWKQRTEWMNATANLLESETRPVSEMITSEMGKPISQSEAEVAKAVTAMRFYAHHAQDFLEGRALEDPASVSASAARTRFDPLGVVLAVMPWNYPVWQVMRFAAPALMAGNAGLLKHASNVPQTAKFLGELFIRAGFPDGSFSTLLINSTRVERVLRDARVAAVTLTGSESAGRSVGAIAGDELKKAVLELGGSDPFIIMPSANLNEAVAIAVKARTANSGQACINAKRFIVHERIYDEFTSKFVGKMESLIVGDPAATSTEIGPLATESGRHEIEELVDDARTNGAKILTGGARPEAGEGWYYPPTVIADLSPEMRLWREEAFGPVASMYKVASVEEAFRVANDSDFGLGSAFWSSDLDEIALAERKIQAGAVFINGMTTSFAELPFGGIKRSGFGRELSMEGIREFCNLKTVWVA